MARITGHDHDGAGRARGELADGGVDLKKVIIGNAELYLGDALVVVPTLAPVDMVFTDAAAAAQTRSLRGGACGWTRCLISSRW